MENKFILFEGLDHTGKSTLAKKLAKKLNATLLHSPTKELESFRKYFDKTDIKTKLAYYITNNHILNSKIRDIKKINSVILDRYFFSTIVYHSIRLNKNLDYLLEDMTTKPDKIYFLTGDIEELTKRIKKSGKEEDVHHAKKLLERESQQYERIFRKYKKISKNNLVVRIDTTDKSISEVYKFILKDLLK